MKFFDKQTDNIPLHERMPMPDYMKVEVMEVDEFLESAHQHLVELLHQDCTRPMTSLVILGSDHTIIMEPYPANRTMHIKPDVPHLTPAEFAKNARWYLKCIQQTGDVVVLAVGRTPTAEVRCWENDPFIMPRESSSTN